MRITIKSNTMDGDGYVIMCDNYKMSYADYYVSSWLNDEFNYNEMVTDSGGAFDVYETENSTNTIYKFIDGSSIVYTDNGITNTVSYY